MEGKLEQYLDNAFSYYEELHTIDELKEELRHDLQEHMSELLEQGYNEEAAYEKIIDSIGDLEETIREVADGARALERNVLTKFSATNLPGSDFRDVTLHNGKFDASAMKDAEFTNSDLTGSSFKASDLQNAIFDFANLTEVNFSTSGLKGASFRGCDLTRTNFNCTGLEGVTFTGAKLSGTMLTKAGLKNANFSGCILNETNFSCSDVSGICFDGLTLDSVIFDQAAVTGTTFRNATLRNVSFYHIAKRSLSKAVFENTVMDKLTYVLLESGGAVLSNVTIM